MKNILITVLAIITIISAGVALYFYKEVQHMRSMAQVQQSVVSETPGVQAGKVQGLLGYPSDYLPQGKLVAKNIVTLKEFTQPVLGNTMKYEFILPVGVYHLKYEINDSNGGAGYHTAFSRCLAVPDCPRDGTILPVTVEAGKTTENVNINDFYSNPDPATF